MSKAQRESGSYTSIMSPSIRYRPAETSEKRAVSQNGISIWLALLCFLVGLIVAFYWR
jgi:hypothetical protein